jgi:uncharacterized protein YggL (DUF469 family)
MDNIVFLFDFEFIPYTNPPDAMDRFTRGLKAFLVARGVDYAISGLGGMVHCRGVVGGEKGRPVTKDDREAVACWAQNQRVQCTARLGALEEDREETQYFRDVTEWVFNIDNLTDEDRAVAAAWLERVQASAERMRAELLKREDSKGV